MTDAEKKHSPIESPEEEKEELAPLAITEETLLEHKQDL